MSGHGQQPVTNCTPARKADCHTSRQERRIEPGSIVSENSLGNAVSL
jgi:hypothetical protein